MSQNTLPKWFPGWQNTYSYKHTNQSSCTHQNHATAYRLSQLVSHLNETGHSHNHQYTFQVYGQSITKTHWTCTLRHQIPDRFQKSGHMFLQQAQQLSTIFREIPNQQSTNINNVWCQLGTTGCKHPSHRFSTPTWALQKSVHFRALNMVHGTSTLDV